MKNIFVLAAILLCVSFENYAQTSGYKSLFDGKTLNGWKFYQNRKNNTWEVKDGTLHCKPLNENVKGDGDERSDIMTVAEFENFELFFDWKISAQGNSGVIYRASEEFGQPYLSGPEYQLVDDENYGPKPTDKQLSGANYDVQAPSKKVVKPVGEWNTSKIVVKGNHVEHWLNGEKVVEYELHSDAWKQQKANSKWKDVAGYGMTKKGHIDLQDHGHEVWFRNILIKEL